MYLVFWHDGEGRQKMSLPSGGLLLVVETGNKLPMGTAMSQCVDRLKQWILTSATNSLPGQTPWRDSPHRGRRKIPEWTQQQLFIWRRLAPTSLSEVCTSKNLAGVWQSQVTNGPVTENRAYSHSAQPLGMNEPQLQASTPTHLGNIVTESGAEVPTWRHHGWKLSIASPNKTWLFRKTATSHSLYRLASYRARPSPISLDRDSQSLLKFFWGCLLCACRSNFPVGEICQFLFGELNNSPSLWDLSAVLQVLWPCIKTASCLLYWVPR